MEENKKFKEKLCKEISAFEVKKQDKARSLSRRHKTSEESLKKRKKSISCEIPSKKQPIQEKKPKVPIIKKPVPQKQPKEPKEVRRKPMKNRYILKNCFFKIYINYSKIEETFRKLLIKTIKR